MRRTAIALALAIPAAALAQDRPPMFPTRDVAVTYRISGGPAQQQGQPTELRMAWLAAEQKVRMDMPGGMGGYMIADHRGQRAVMVMEQQRMLMELPYVQAQQQFQPSATARFTREGTDRVAGVACTIWLFEDQGRSGRGCITNDGVMLRASGTGQGQPGGIEAIQVTYGTQDPARFQPPSGYQTMQMPTQPPAQRR